MPYRQCLFLYNGQTTQTMGVNMPYKTRSVFRNFLPALIPMLFSRIPEFASLIYQTGIIFAMSQGMGTYLECRKKTSLLVIRRLKMHLWYHGMMLRKQLAEFKDLMQSFFGHNTVKVGCYQKSTHLPKRIYI